MKQFYAPVTIEENANCELRIANLGKQAWFSLPFRQFAIRNSEFELSSMVLSLALLLSVAACGKTAPESGGGAGNAAKPAKLAFVTNNTAEFWTLARRGVEKASSELSGVS